MINHSSDSKPGRAQRALKSQGANEMVASSELRQRRLDGFMEQELPKRSALQPSHDLLAILEDCHNHIYANDGLLKDKIFHEFVKLILLKLHDEQGSPEAEVRFGITGSEYTAISRVGASPAFENRLSRLVQEVRAAHGDLLGEHDDSFVLSPRTLAFVVARLQTISLSKTEGDVKGEAFQTFIYRHQRGDRGEFFTPYPMVRLAVTMMDPTPHLRVADPACGSGGFLIEAFKSIRKAYPSEARKWIQSSVVGIEFNPDVARAAAIRIRFEGGTGDEILRGNALADFKDLAATFDLVLTNPPFGSRGRIEDPAILSRYELARKWVALGEKRWKMSAELVPAQTPEILFLERCVQLLKPDGRMAIVLPDGILHNVSLEHVRHWLLERCHVLAVVSFPQETFVPYGTGIKTSLLFLRKIGREPRPARVFMAEVDRLGYDVKGQPVFVRDGKGQVQLDSAGRPKLDEEVSPIAQAFLAPGKQREESSDSTFTIAYSELNSRLDVGHYLPSDRRLMESLGQTAVKPLGEIAEIVADSDNFRSKPEQTIRYVAISDVDALTMQVVSRQTMRAHEAPSRAKYRLQAGDIITATSGASTGTHANATAYVTDEDEGAICSNGFAVVRKVREVDPCFLLAYMRSDLFLRQVRRRMTGHAIPSISSEEFAKVLVPIPSAEDQMRIAMIVRRLLAVRMEALATSAELSESIGSLLRQA